MPALSSTMKEGKIVSWSKKVGDKVSSGEVLLVVESDKADMDVESYEDGYLAAIYTPEGGTAAVGACVAVLVDSVGEISSVGKSGPSAAAAAPAPAAAAAAAPAAASLPAGNFESIMMPALSSTMKEGKIVSWSKKVGDKVSSGEVLLVVESDKADMDVESYEDGYLASILVKEGESTLVGNPVCLLAKSAADLSAVQAAAAAIKSGGAMPAAAGAAPAVAASAATNSGSASTAPAPSGQRVGASGYARALATEQGIDLKTVQSSRSDGLITARDLASGSKAGPASSSYVPAAGTINASPKARKLAADEGLELSKIRGTGNFGRVLPDDVLKAAGKWVAPPSPAPVAAAPGSAAAAAAPAVAKKGKDGAAVPEVLDGIVPMNAMQKAVAKNMEKTMEAPVFRVSREIYTDEFDALYADLKPKGVTVSSLLARAVAEVLKKHQIVNAAYVEGGIKYNKDINVAMAVAIDGGLMTPTITKCQDKDLFLMSREWKELVEKAKAKKLTPAEYSSGTFTISNLGMLGVSEFGALLPPGTGSILAISASLPKVCQLKNGYLGVRKAMVRLQEKKDWAAVIIHNNKKGLNSNSNLSFLLFSLQPQTVTITCDHRHIYGADAAEFLKDLADLLENNPRSLLM